jgi:protease-4
MLLLRLVGLLLDLLFFPLRALSLSRAVPDGAFLTLTIDGAVADVVARPRLFELQLRPQKAVSLHALSETVDLAIADRRVRGLVLTLKELRAGMAGATSLRAQLARLRAAGKEVVVHLPMGAGTKEVYVATAASKVLVAPATQLAPLGFLSSTRYVKRALDRAGVEPEVFACGEYKSAGETLVRDAMSDAQREQMAKLLDGFHDAVLEGIAAGRGVTTGRAEELVDGGPYHAEAAVENGLADGVAYEDEVPLALGLPRRKGVARRMFIDAGDYRRVMQRPLLRPLRRPPRIAVIPVHGPIAHAPGPVASFSTDERLARLARAARSDRGVVGVVLHVDSPGGSALASDRMHHEIVQLAREKPVVACMANVAASGGYYVAAPAHKIVCEATTITGSIGVVGVRVTIDALLAKIGITTESIRRGARVGLLGASVPLTEDERKALRRELDATYRTFVRVVAEGRKKTVDEIEPLARGRVYTGADALAVGLVDVLGGFEAAIREVRAMIPPPVRDRAQVQVMRLPRRPIPPLDPPQAAPARSVVMAMLEALLPAPERALVMLGATGERVLALFSGVVE